MPESDNTPSPMQYHRYNKNKLIAVAVLLILGLAIAGVLYWKSNDASSNNGAKYAYSYEKTDNFVLAGPAAGSGIGFVKPTEFTPPAAVTSGAEQAILTHNISRDSTTITLGSIAVAAVAAQPPSADYLKTLDTAIMDPKNTNHVNIIAPLGSFITDRIDPRYTVDLGTARHLTNDNVKSNAWLVDFTATDENKDEKIKVTTFKGQVALLAGKKTYYYFMLGAVDYNWTTNSETWSAVRNSLKIDQ